MKKHAHCSYCGHPYGADQPWPRQCAGCRNIAYLNPIPVAVCLLPIEDGLLCVRRAIPPGRGELALPGGYVDRGETWQQAVTRELHEETGIVIDPEGVRLFAAHSAARDGVLLVFGLAPPWRGDPLANFKPHQEVSELVIVRRPVQLAFSFHTQVIGEYFAAPR